jgi:hypothetical protein
MGILPQDVAASHDKIRPCVGIAPLLQPSFNYHNQTFINPFERHRSFFAAAMLSLSVCARS